jgi:TolB protein
MRRLQQPAHIKWTFLLLVVCLAALSMTNVLAQQAKAFFRKSVRSATQSPTPAPSRGKYNGKLVFNSNRQNDGGIKIWTMNSDGSNRTQLTFESDRDPALPPYLYDERPKWSPDGSRIAFGSINRSADVPARYTIYIMDYPSRNVQRLVLSQLDSLSSEACPGMGGVEWSPDGSKFVFYYGKIISADDFCQGPFSTNIYTVNVDGSGLVRLTKDANLFNYSPTWSPDGSQISFISGDGDGRGYSTIHIMNADGSNRRQILTSYSWSALWSPDGSKILFAYAGQLYTVKPEGTDVRQLTHPPTYYSYGRWSPDGKKIAVVRDVNCAAGGVSDGIFVMDSDGNGEQNISNFDVITNCRVDDNSVDWQPLLAPANDPPPSFLGFDSGIYLAMYPNPSNVQINVTRTGNVDQAVSCDYQVRSGPITAGLPGGTLNFAPGEASKTIPFSWDYGYTFNINLFNNAGNATFVGGLKDATIIFADKNQNPIDSSSFFVRQQYRDFLNREPDPSGWNFWTNNIDGSCTTGDKGATCRAANRVNTSAAFFLSIEFQQTGYLVYRTYKAAFGNLPGAPVPIRFAEFLPDTRQIGQGVVVGQSGWEQALETNKQNFMTSFVQRSRFTSAYPNSMTVQQFVDALYTNAGLVPTSAPNRPKAISEFNLTTPSDPAARARALRDVAEDAMLTQQEFNRAFVLMQYFGYLRRNPNDAPDSDFGGYNFWLGKLNQFGGNYQAAEMVKAFIVSSEYRQRFGP